MKKFLLLALLPLLMFTACGQHRTTTTVTTTDPTTGQQQTTTTTEADDYGASQNYQVYQGPNGEQMVVTSINGQQMYVPYNVFQQQMAIGGYGALNDYYYSNPSYFHPYSSFAAGWVLANALSGTYGGYYNRYHINTYNTYRYQHTPYYRTSAYRQSRLGTSGQSGYQARNRGGNYNTGGYNNANNGRQGGMRSEVPKSYQDPNAGRAGGMRSANTGYTPQARQNTYRATNTGGGGMRAGGNSGGMRSGGGGSRSGGGMRSGKR